MIEVTTGDILEAKAQTLVNTVNCVGVMGKGIAFAFKKRFPAMFHDYVKRCRAGEVKLGRPYLYRGIAPPDVLNFPTKDHWRSVSRLEDIIRGLEYLARLCREWGIESLAVPPLGCGQGQLEWRVVGPTLYRHLKRLAIPVTLYAPFDTPDEELRLDFLETGRASAQAPSARIAPAWIALVMILSRIENEPHHWPVGRIIFQKIAYFATESGIPTRLGYRRSSFGPYSPELKGVVTKLVNNGLIAERKLGRMFTLKVGPTFEDAQATYMAHLEKWRERVENVADLFMRIRRTDQAELAATVHYAARTLGEANSRRITERDVLTEVMEWKRRRQPPLDAGKVALAIRNLAMLGWLDVQPSQNLPVPAEVSLGA